MLRRWLTRLLVLAVLYYYWDHWSPFHRDAPLRRNNPRWLWLGS